MIRPFSSCQRPSRPSGGSGSPPQRSRRSRTSLGLLLWCLFGIVGVSGFAALGVWQLERRVWKLDLIQRVNERVDATPVAAPGVDQWPGITRAGDEYLRVKVTGTFLAHEVTLVHAGTRLGTGYWVMTPLRRADGTVVLINRGYVAEQNAPAAAAGERTPDGVVTVQGLLRISEPNGGFLRDNDAQGNRWYSRDVQAMARARGLAADRVAPYFIDAGTPGPAAAPVAVPTAENDWPVGGLTVIHFRNAHMEYAITWFCLALLVLGCVGYVVRDDLLRHSR